MWEAPHIEWYDPALRDRDTHVVVNADTAPTLLAALNADAARQMQLAEGAAKVRRSLMCPDCVANYVRRLAEAVRLQTGADSVLDDPASLKTLVEGVPGACAAFVDESGGSLCAFLATNSKAPREAEGDDDVDSNAPIARPVDPVDLEPRHGFADIADATIARPIDPVVLERRHGFADIADATIARPVDPVDLIPDEIWDAELEARPSGVAFQNLYLVDTARR